jgi:hypothetical protein
MAGSGVVLVLTLIATALDHSAQPKPLESPIVNATSSENVNATIIVLPETGNQQISLIDGKGVYNVGPVQGMITLSDVGATKGNDVISVVYQAPSERVRFAYLLLFSQVEGKYEQKSLLFLGENVTVSDIEVADTGYGGYIVLTTFHTPESLQDNEVLTAERIISVDVNNGYFDPTTAIFIK